MEKIISVLEELQKINEAYEISAEPVEQVKKEAAKSKVCTPVIGKFSSGKSALINTVLGYNRKILKEDITPETAVPAEIVYTGAEEGVAIIKNDGTCQNISVDEYRDYEADAGTVKCARLHLRNSFLEQIPDVMLVDMPGFESGYEIHNKAIDDYLPQSLAYIIAFPADDMIVRSSVGNILKELCLHDMPLCVVITKYDKKNDDFDETFSKMKDSLKRFVGDREITYCMTSSFTGDAEELEEFLKGIQQQSRKILQRKYAGSVYGLIEDTENYLKTLLNSSQMSESELDEQEERLKTQLSGLDTKLAKERTDFDIESEECIEEIKNDVRCAIESETSTLVAMAMNNQDIKDHLNNVVRNTVTVSVKKRFLPRMGKYLKRVAKTINGEAIGDIHITFDFDTEGLNKGIASSVVAVAAGILLGLPVLGVVVGAVVGLVTKLQRDKKREEAKQKIRGKLQNEVYPQILEEVGKGIQRTIKKQVELINCSIEKELENQRNLLEKAMDEVRGKAQAEKEEKESLAADIRAGLERLEELKDELR